MIRRLYVIVVVLACSSGDSEGTATEHRQSQDSLLATEVVQALVTPASAGRLIYERPADLSYDSLRLKRPDLVRSADRRSR